MPIHRYLAGRMQNTQDQEVRDSVPERLSRDAEMESIRKAASFRVSRIIFPISIGLGVVGYLMWKNFDPAAFSQITWGPKTAVWLAIGLGAMILRHLAYSYRLWILSDGDFSFMKCVELMFIWLFSSSVTPTSVGGAAVALVALTKEKLSSARTAVIVLYTVVADTFFFITTLILFYLFFGPTMIKPGATSLADLDRWGNSFLIGFSVMILYGSFFAYGLFIDPHRPRRALEWVTRWKLLHRWRAGALETGREFVEASREIVKKTLRFHILTALTTIAAWGCRFILLICLILAFVPGVHFDVITQMRQFARIEAMFVIMEFSPTPGGAGIAEFAVSHFLSEWVPAGIVLIIAFLWRILEFYSYLLIGAIVVPTWIRKVYKRSREGQSKS